MNNEYWNSQETRLRTLFQQRVRERLSPNDIQHLSVFAIAPQPLLILLGTLLGDMTASVVYQRHREPVQTWKWRNCPNHQSFEAIEPKSSTGTPALVLAISGNVTPDRITQVLPDASIWTVTVPSPNNDVVRTREQLIQFRELTRQRWCVSSRNS